MRIKQITSQHRLDFTAVMVCEHCGEEEKLTTGYNDSFYHENVIPAMCCKSCGRDRAGIIESQDQLPA